MPTRIATVSASGKAPDAARALARGARAKLGTIDPVLVLAFGSTLQPLEDLMPVLVREFPTATCLGASTAGEFTEESDTKGSAVLFALGGDYKVFAGLGTGLRANAEGAIERSLAGLPRQLHGYPHRTALLLLDPLSGNGEEAALLAASILGEDVTLAGGAAGDDLQMRATHVACGPRSMSDAVVVALIFSKKPLGVGVCHGHVPLSPPLRVTRADGATVYEIDRKPAWPTWLAQTSGRTSEPAKEDEGAYLLRYQAGLATGDEYKIRAPLARGPDDSIHFACGIPTGAVLRVMDGEPEQQVASARQAARRALAQLGDRKVAGALVFDCICRKLILKDDFTRAVRGIAEELGGVPLAGFETYGEIALNAGDMSGFHNTTSVVLAFPE